MAGLACGSIYSFNIVAHNVVGRSDMSATITAPTLGSPPKEIEDISTIILGKEKKYFLT